jgi:hypothetical protein
MWRGIICIFGQGIQKIGAPVEVFTNQGTKFHGEFQELYESSFINHCITSQHHLEVDGLVERMVDVTKRGFWRYGLQKGRVQNWNLVLPWLIVGYRFNHQASFTSFFPFILLFGHEPNLLSIWQDVMAIINLDYSKLWFQACEYWKALLWCLMSMAMDNLVIVQHQNTLQYTTTRRWILTSNSWIQAKKLYELIINNINYFGCDSKTCYFANTNGFTF